MVKMTLLSNGPGFGMVSILSFQSLFVHLISFLSWTAAKCLMLQRITVTHYGNNKNMPQKMSS